MTFPLPLAFGFASPLMLWGMALGGVPIVIHLLHKRRYIEMPWAAMRFLVAATKKNSKRLRLEQILLLIIRTLILLFVALAMARPATHAMNEFLRSEGPRHRIIVVDATISMGYSTGERSRFDKAKDAARGIVRGMRQGDAINLVRLADSSPRVVVRRPTYQPAALLDEIDQLSLLDERVDVSSVLKEVEDLLALAPEIGRKEIVLVTDLQASAWSPSESNEAARIKASLKRMSERARITFLDVGEAGAANAAITNLRADAGFALAGRGVPMVATIRNYSSVGAVGQAVELHSDDRLADTRRVDLTIGTDVRVDFAPVFGVGERRVEIRLKPDGLKVDDARRLVLPVRDELQVLLVNGKPSGEPMGNATDFLRMALAPELPNRAFISAIRPTVIREGELLGTDLTRFDAVFLCNVALLTDREAGVLRSYLEAGGGLIICLGDLVRPDSYNQTLLKPGESTGGSRESTQRPPILPARLIERVGDPKTKDDAFEFDAGDFTHPIVRPFQGNPGAGLEQTQTFAYFKTEIPKDSSAVVPLRFNNGDPAIIDSPCGRGRVILVTTSVDREWSTWAVWGHSLIPLMHETVNHAVSGRWANRDVLVGQPLTSHLPSRASDVSAVLLHPDGETETPVASSDDRSVTSEPTSHSGFYKMSLGTPVSRTDWFAVNVDPLESDLASLRVEELKSDVFANIEFSYVTEWKDGTGGGDGSLDPTPGDPGNPGEAPSGDEPLLVKTSATGSGLSRGLLYAALSLLVVELLMAWHFPAGAGSLAAIVLMAVTFWLWTVSPFAGIAGGIATVAAAVWGWNSIRSRSLG